MLGADELARLSVQIREIDQILRSLSDYRQYPMLLTREDAHLQSFLDHVVSGVRDARLLSAKILDRLESESASLEESAPEIAPPEPPPAPPEPERIQPPVNLERITMANPTGMRQVVLIADADPATLERTESMLTDEDFRVLSVRGGFEAVSIYGRLWAAIDLVVLDFDLPDLSGEMVFEELLAINPHVAAVISGGFDEPAKLNQMLSRGLSGFLPKPYERERLIRQIERVLASRPLHAGHS